MEFKPKHTPRPMLITGIFGAVLVFLFVIFSLVMGWQGRMMVGLMGGIMWLIVSQGRFPTVIKFTDANLTIDYLDYLKKAHTLTIPLQELSAKLLVERSREQVGSQLVLYLYQNQKQKMRLEQRRSGFTQDELNRLYQAIKTK